MIKKTIKKMLLALVSAIAKKINVDIVPFRVAYNEDGMIIKHNIAHLVEKRFMHSYALGKSANSWGGKDIQWRSYVCCWAASKAIKLEGDFVECGVNTGGSALAIIDYTNFSNTEKKFYLLDTFCGFSKSLFTKEERARIDGVGKNNNNNKEKGGYQECFSEVVSRFSDIANVIIVRGEVPGTLSQVHSKKVSYLHIDMNCVKPEIETLEYFWDKVVSGGVIILDDYGANKHYIQRQGHEEFADRMGVEILALPTTQGLIFKP